MTSRPCTWPDGGRGEADNDDRCCPDGRMHRWKRLPRGWFRTRDICQWCGQTRLAAPAIVVDFGDYGSLISGAGVLADGLAAMGDRALQRARGRAERERAAKAGRP
jgi:hypothetical protein